MANPAPQPVRLTVSGTSSMTPTTSVFSSRPTAPAAPPPPPPVGVGLKTDGVAEAQMRQAIRELVQSVDAGGRLDKDAEDALLDVASEFLESVTNFSSRLARHRGSEVLEVKDLQLHLERHHKIRVPGFVSTEEIGKPPAFGGSGGATGSSAAAASSTTAGTSTNAQTGTTTTTNKGKEKSASSTATGSAPSPIRSKRLAAVKQATK